MGRVRRTVSLLFITMGATLLTACDSLVPPKRHSHPACRCSLEVSGFWTEQDLMEGDSLEVGNVFTDQYAFAEFLPMESMEDGVYLATIADHYIADDLSYDPSTAPERTHIDGHPAALRWLRGVEVDGIDIYGVHAVVAYPDGYLRAFAWAGLAQNTGEVETALTSIVRSLRHEPEPPSTDRAEAAEEPALSSLRAQSDLLARRSEYDERTRFVESPPDGMVPSSYVVPPDPELGPSEPTELLLHATPLAEDRRPALVLLGGLDGIADSSRQALGELAQSGKLVVARPMVRGDFAQPGRWDVMGTEMVDVVAAIRHVQARPDVDPERVVVVGLGVGGGRALMAATEVDGIAAVYAVDPPANLQQLRETFPTLWGVMPYDQSVPENDAVRSPERYLAHLKAWATVLSTSYADLVPEAQSFRAWARHEPDGPLHFLPLERVGSDEYAGLLSVLGAQLAAGQVHLDYDDLAPWTDEQWTTTVEVRGGDLRRRVHAYVRMGLFTDEWVRTQVVARRGLIDERPAVELTKRAIEDAPPKSPVFARVADTLRSDGWVVRFAIDDVSGMVEEVKQRNAPGYLAASTDEILRGGTEGTMYLYYGGGTVEPDVTRRVGETLAQRLRQAGLQVFWDGDPDTALMVVLPWGKSPVEAPEDPTPDAEPDPTTARPAPAEGRQSGVRRPSTP